ncbi:MAG TPA: cytochrome c [Acetobacteraceae bacterium]|nr:cytochrome c [Acetobacteraceae bacterium]
MIGARRLSLAVPLAALLLLAGCDDMTNQARQKTWLPEPSPAPLPTDLVQFEERGTEPPPVTLALLQRGQEQFRIYCTPCHGELGLGNGMIVQRGFPRPPAYTDADLLRAPDQHFYNVITKGWGVMYSFADRVKPADRWAITAYIRALQLSQHASVDDLTPEERILLR